MIKLSKKQKNDYLYNLESFKSNIDEDIARYNNSIKNKNGGEHSALEHSLTTIAKLEYILNQDKEKFIQYQSESAEIDYDYFVRFILQRNLNIQYEGARSTIDYFFKFLSVGNINKAAKFISLTQEISIESEEGYCFADLMHYLLKKLLQGKLYDFSTISKHIELAKKSATTYKVALKGMEGYITVFQGIFEHNLEMVQEGFIELLAGHNYQCKYEGYYDSTYQQHIFYWGIGLANLCRYKGINVEINHPLIPNELIIPLNTNGDTLEEIAKTMVAEKNKILNGEYIQNPIIKNLAQPSTTENKKIIDHTCKNFHTTIEEIKYRKINRINQYIDYIDLIKYQDSMQAYATFKYPQQVEELAIQIIQLIGDSYNDKDFIKQGIQIFKLPCSYCNIYRGYFSEFTYDYKRSYYLLLDNEPLKIEYFIDFAKAIKRGFITSAFDLLDDYLGTTKYTVSPRKKSNNTELYDCIIQLIEKLKIKNINLENFNCDECLYKNGERAQFAKMESEAYLNILGREIYNQGYSLLDIDTGVNFYIYSPDSYRMKYPEEVLGTADFNRLIECGSSLNLPDFSVRMAHYHAITILKNEIVPEVLELLNKLSKLDNQNNLNLKIYGLDKLYLVDSGKQPNINLQINNQTVFDELPLLDDPQSFIEEIDNSRGVIKSVDNNSTHFVSNSDSLFPDDITQRNVIKKICKDFNTTLEALKERKQKRISRYIDYIDPIKYQLSTVAYNALKFPKVEENLAIQIIQYIGDAYNDNFFVSQGIEIIKLPCSLYNLTDEQLSFAAYTYNNEYYLLLDNEPYDNEVFLDFTQRSQLTFLDQTFHCLQAYLSITGYTTSIDCKANNQEFYFAIMQLIEDLQIQNIDAINFTDDSYINDDEGSKFSSMEIEEYLELIGKELYKQGYSLLNIDTTGYEHQLMIVPKNVSKKVLPLMKELVLKQSKCS